VLGARAPNNRLERAVNAHQWRAWARPLNLLVRRPSMNHASSSLTAHAIDLIAAAVFSKPGAEVLEAYSDHDREPLGFRSATELADYAKEKVLTQRALAFVFVRYPDMRGSAILDTIYLRPGAVTNHRRRYTWQGWGLISVQLQGGGSPHPRSRVSANSKARALKWAPTQPGWAPPTTWDWNAIQRHTRRLQRALNEVAQQSLEGAVRGGSIAAGAGRQCAPAAPIGGPRTAPQLHR
jgi:hypothetical protein